MIISNLAHCGRISQVFLPKNISRPQVFRTLCNLYFCSENVKLYKLAEIISFIPGQIFALEQVLQTVRKNYGPSGMVWHCRNGSESGHILYWFEYTVKKPFLFLFQFKPAAGR